MRAILVHGMLRSPLSQLVLAKRLRSAGIRVHLFGYSTFRPFATSLRRLARRVSELPSGEPFVMVGHSLGCVLIRASLPLLPRQPVACFFLAPPNRVPKAARFFAASRLYRFLTRDSGQLLNDESFMSSLPVPPGLVRVYAGTAGPKGRLSPFLQELNDGVLTVAETEFSAEHPSTLVPSLHTFIMNSERVANDITTLIGSLHEPR
jgi:hypothetical protein